MNELARLEKLAVNCSAEPLRAAMYIVRLEEKLKGIKAWCEEKPDQWVMRSDVWYFVSEEDPDDSGKTA